jgi:hypothetical protein
VRSRVDKADLVAGLLIAAIGAYFLHGGLAYQIGTLTRMGPGFLPVTLGAIGIGLGLLIMLLAVGRAGALPRVSLRAALSVLLAIAAFGLLLERVGLVPAIVVAVLIAARGDPNARLLVGLTLALVIALASWLVFIVVLGLSMHPFRLPF